MDGKDRKLIEKPEKELKGARPVKSTDVYEREGVFYSPSKEKIQPPANSVYKSETTRQTQRPAPKAKMKRVKNSYKIFLSITIAVGVIVCVLVLVLMFNIFSKQLIKPADPADNMPDLTIKNPEQTNSNLEILEFIGVLKNVYDGELSILDVNDEKIYNINTTGKTELKDKYGQPIIFAELKVGDILEVHYEEASLTAELLKLTGQAWEQRSITGILANAENKTISIGNQTYYYTDEIINLSPGKLTNIANIAITDLVTITGYNNNVWTIKLEKSHAFVEVLPNEKIKDGIIEIGTEIYIPVADAKKITITEGAHKIVVKAPNIETYIQDIKVEMNHTAVLDLSKVQIKKSVVVIRTNVTEYTLLVNDSEITEISEPLILEYGKYKIDIQKEDYLPYSSEINVNQDTISLNITLEEKLKVGKINFDTSPAGASIFVDNAIVGISPIEALIEFGEHRIVARKEGYQDFSYTIEVTEKPKDYFITLTPVPAPVVPETPTIPNDNTNTNTNTETDTTNTNTGTDTTNSNTTPTETVPAFEENPNPSPETNTETNTETNPEANTDEPAITN